MKSDSEVRARVLSSTAADEIVAELHARGSDKTAVERTAARGRARAVLVGPVALEHAQALRAAASEAGAMASLARAAGRADPARAEVLLMGAEDALCGTASAVGGEVGARIEQALRALRTRPALWRCRERELPLGERTLVMGIINVTPDSFSGDGLGSDVEAAVAQGRRMVAEGADTLDVGGESTRPGSEPVEEAEQIRRVVPVIEGLADLDVPISVDTYRSRVAAAGLGAGASIVNDISGLHYDADMAKVVAASGAGLIVMHIQGTPRDMQKDPKYADVIGEIGGYLEEGVRRAEAAGIARDRIVVDPGIGFGKTLEHNLVILRRLGEFRWLGCPILVGTSRKSMIGKILDLPADERVEGTAATVALAIAAGADIVRVHDVKEMVRVARVADAIVRVKHELVESEEAQRG